MVAEETSKEILKKLDLDSDLIQTRAGYLGGSPLFSQEGGAVKGSGEVEATITAYTVYEDRVYRGLHITKNHYRYIVETRCASICTYVFINSYGDILSV